MENNKIYIFGYATIQDPRFYEKFISKHTLKRPAILNGYVKCIDSENNFLIKKDNSGHIDGWLFEVSKEELFTIDRWNKYPHYQRHTVNVLATDKNEIIENVEIYTKLELGEVFLAPEDKEILQKLYVNEKELNSFLKLEDMNKNSNLLDKSIIFKLNDADFNKIKNVTHPYMVLVIEDVIKKQYLFEHYALIPLKLDGMNYALLVSFAQNNGLNCKFYYDSWENDKFNASLNISWKPLYDFDGSFIAKLKPDKYINLKWDPNIKMPKLGGYNDKTFEYVISDFDIDPFKRLNLIIGILKEYKNLK
ncbi:gamma-glutamylcyclotransferase family protein [Mycoplasma enhydrae]|uniref:gamma-glutamylcyclotransferase family protein n=1 Tax=Mycoplasma enhydrae TaxID=2499220 RepID=UPI00197B8CE0|nr:gamma-glutamylcyclotransferase family protein [Mycoplasma enhydrae]MBN4089680.1 gamma-glutamylcyclotransferase [Mycoplasma enhydrae]